GPGRLPGRLTMRLPHSVGRGMRSWAVSWRMAERGTPASRTAAATCLAMAASCPGAPSTGRERLSPAQAAGSWLANAGKSLITFGPPAPDANTDSGLTAPGLEDSTGALLPSPSGLKTIPVPYRSPGRVVFEPGGRR